MKTKENLIATAHRTGSRFWVVALVLSAFATHAVAMAQDLGVRAGVTIESAVLEDDGAQATLDLSWSRRGRWLAGSRPDGLITLTLVDTALDPSVVDLVDSGGLVASVRFVTDVSSSAPTTSIQIRTREKSSYSVAATDGSIRVSIAAVGLSTPSPVGGSNPPPANAPSRPAEPVALESPPANDGGAYRMGAGDVIQVEVFGLPELTRETRILRDGTITLPLLGSVWVADLGLREAEQKIAELLAQRRLVNQPQVSIFVKTYFSRGVSIQGAVTRPGVYQMVESRTLLEMIGEAGGLLTGDRAGRTIIILRDRQGRQERTELDAARLVDYGDLSLNQRIQPGDIIMVPPPKVYRVFVSGAVQNSGTVEFSSSEAFTVFQAITAAGGPTERANLRKVTVIRRLADGTQDRIELNLKKVRKGTADDVLLENGDTIVVGEWFF